jgi:nucleoside-diphosphate-sugar epimerase
MNITILGGGGFLGRKIADQLAASGKLGDRAVTSLTLFDLHPPPPLKAAFPVHCVGGDVAELPQAAIPAGTDVVFHLAAVVSAAAEADYDLGRRVNLHGNDAVIDACRGLSAPPRVVFTSSVASFAGGQRAMLADDARQMPTNSYGAQKAAAEIILADASRRGFLDLVSIRLPTICIRPGAPNKAASSFVSSIVREPLLGLATTLPVPEEFAVWIASPAHAVAWLLHAAAMDTSLLGADRGVNPPGLSVTTGAMLDAMEAVRPGTRALVSPQPDATVAAIIGGWPAAFAPVRAPRVGFVPHGDLRGLIEEFLAHDLAPTRAMRGL